MSKLDRSLDKLDRGFNRLQTGCLTVLANLFFTGFCVWGVYAALGSYRLETNGETTVGRVIDMLEQDSAESGCCVYVPVIEYQVQGAPYSMKGDIASDPPQYKVGEQVSILYDPADPKTAQIDRWSERWLFPALIIPAMLLAAILLNFFVFRAWLRGGNLDVSDA